MEEEEFNKLAADTFRSLSKEQKQVTGVDIWITVGDLDSLILYDFIYAI